MGRDWIIAKHRKAQRAGAGVAATWCAGGWNAAQVAPLRGIADHPKSISVRELDEAGLITFAPQLTVLCQ